MLDDIEIRGLGVIAAARLPLSPGFTAITGETGAGKTMVVTALNLLLGGRGTSDLVRAGADRATVTGHALVPADGEVARLVEEIGGEVDDAGLVERADGADALPKDAAGERDAAVAVVLSRQVAASGRSRAWLGGTAVPVGTLARAGEALVAVHGQQDQLRLTREDAQRAALDAFGGPELQAAAAHVAASFDALQETETELDRLRACAAEREHERAELTALADDIAAAAPEAGEDAALRERIDRLANLETLREHVTAAHEAVAGEHPAGSLRERLREVEQHLDRAARTDPAAAEQAATAVDLGFRLDDLASGLAGYLADLEGDANAELGVLRERLDVLEGLKFRYRGSLDEVRARAEAAEARLAELAGEDTRIPALEARAVELCAQLEAGCTELRAHREAAAAILAERVTAELHALAMPHASLHVEVTAAPEVRRNGADRVQLLLAPHPGAAPLPLATGASGGELSRVMLALEVVLQAESAAPTLVFDEVDAGVGGAAALEIAARLQRLAATSQVICVTHLAQVAAYADHHVRIEKSTDGQVTTSSIRELDEDGRVEELARLLSGLRDSESGRAHARELLARARGGVG